MGDKAKGDTAKAGAEAAGPDDPVQAFIAALNDEPEGGHVLHGMVKPAETDDGMMFAHAGGCGQWMFVPAKAIHAVRGTGRVPCQGHFHMGAEIALKAPQSELEKTLAAAANLHLASFLQLRAALPGAAADDHGCTGGKTWKNGEFGPGCYY